MFVVTGITGKVGAMVAETLLAKGQRVRAVVREAGKGRVWRDRGCEVAVVPDAADAQALSAAMQGAAGVFLMMPPDYDPAPGFPRVHALAEAARTAIAASMPGRVVFLSTVGAQVPEFNLLNNSAIVEAMLGQAKVPVALLRAAWFLDNAAWDVSAARNGRIESYLQPVERAIDMVGTRDIGRLAAELLMESWQGRRIVELAGPRKVSPQDIAAAFSKALGRPVEVRAIPRESWEPRFRTEGMQHPEGRIRMLDGFNEGWIDFQRQGTEQRTGSTSLDEVISNLVAAA
jgi:uncharacterized protein YbjT (DUF2867 family)